MKTPHRILSVAALILAGAPLVASADPVQWKIDEGGNGHYYEVITASGIAWTDANNAASGMSYEGGTGYLVTITSEEEDDFIASLLGFGEVWAGGKQDPNTKTPTANWVWANGEGSIPGVNGGPGGYANWAPDEPNDSGAGEKYLGIGWKTDRQWNDEGALGNIKGYVVEYEAGIARVVPGEDVPVFNQAGKSGSPNPLSAAYQNVLEGGRVKISCCTVLDEREGDGYYQSNPFDLGLAMRNQTNESCFKDDVSIMPASALEQGVAVLQKWQRGVPGSEGQLGVCVLESDVESKGILFTADDASNVMGFDVDCTAKSVDDRPFTGSVRIDQPEVDAPFVVRRSADCDLSRTGLRSSTNVIVLNLRHDTAQLATNPYLSQYAAALKASINQINAQGCGNSGFFGDLASKVQSAKGSMQKAATNKGLPKTANDAVIMLDDATKQAMLIGSYKVGDGQKYPADPYGACLDNPQGTLVSRLMALKFAACSELKYRDSYSSSSMDGEPEEPEGPHCVIDKEIWDALPDLPGQCRYPGDPDCESEE